MTDSEPPGYCCGHCLCSPSYRAACDRWARRGDRVAEGQDEWPRPFRAGRADLRRASTFLRERAAAMRGDVGTLLQRAVHAPHAGDRAHALDRARSTLHGAIERTTRAAGCALAVGDEPYPSPAGTSDP